MEILNGCDKIKSTKNKYNMISVAEQGHTIIYFNNQNPDGISDRGAIINCCKYNTNTDNNIHDSLAVISHYHMYT